MRRLLQAFVDERVVLAVITFNLVVLFARSYPSMHPHDAALFVLDYICLVYFVGEMVTKISLFGWRTYWASGINRFDFIIVAASAPTLLAPFTHGDELTVVLVFRAARLLRFLRVLRFIPHADQLWAGIGRALRASVGLILAIVLYLVVMGLIASHLFGEAAPDHFADPVTSIYSIFKVFTVEGWYTVPDLIAETQGPLMGFVARGFFTIAVVTGGLLGLGITNAVLVDEMVMDNNDELEERITGLTLEVEQLRADQAIMLARLQATVEALVEARRPPPGEG